ncbi:hypothetical protein [Deinococcus sp.]|uniref:hypothetical protein n=1 Tax=Deinococcus sp. TaxID=47478 RepID=UPI003C7A99BD
MPSKLLTAALLLGPLASAAPAAFPWAQGHLDPGRSFARPLLFTQDQQKAGPPVPGWSRVPLPVRASGVWPAQSLGVVKAELLPGVPEPLGQSWRVPVGLRLGTLRRPSVLQLSGLGRLSAALAVHPGLSVPATFEPGQEFLRTDFGVVYRQKGSVLDVPALAGRVLTLRRLEGETALFGAEGLGEVERVGNPAQGFPDLAPLIADPQLAALKRRYEGHTVWGYGGLHTRCALDQSFSADRIAPLGTAVRVRRVLRLGQPMLLNVQGGPGQGEITSGADAVTLTPLVFLLDAAPFRVVGDFGGAYTGSALSDILSPSQIRERATLAFMTRQARRPDLCGLSVPYALMDTWAVTRVFSLTPPSRELLTLSTNLPPDGRSLTRWQYAWLHGFPSSTFASLSELLKLAVWHYRNVPAEITVRFSPAGHVTDVKVPSLP